MKKILHICTSILLLLPMITLHAQKHIIMGTVKNSLTSEKLSSVTVAVKKGPERTISDGEGKINLPFSGNYPVTLVLSSIGFEAKEITLAEHKDVLEISMIPYYAMADAIIVYGLKTPSSLLRSPVTHDRISFEELTNGGKPDFYQEIAKLKGVDITTSGLFFNTVSTRGFNGSGNLRLNQYLDGMDNQAPGLNFSVGNLLGMSDLDVGSIELLSGASSALYGSGGLTGTLLMKSKSAFDHQGLSVLVKEGVMHIDNRQRNASPYHDIAARFAKSFNNKFAFKVNAQLIKANDWEAQDKSNLERTSVLSKPKPGDRNSDPNYDGVNVYGDELNFDMFTTSYGVIQQVKQGYREYYKNIAGVYPSDAQTNNFISNHPDYKYTYEAFNKGKIPHQNVSRTGYDEKDMVDYNTYNVKLSGGLYYKLTPNTELSVVGYWGTGTTVYTGADRYSLKGVKMGQYKIELENKKWMLRAFTTQENAGQAYNTTALASYINESWKPSEKWFPEYMNKFGQNILAGKTAYESHLSARDSADLGRYLPGTPAFQKEFDRISKTPIVDKGALFLDKTDLYQVEGQIDLTDKIKVMNVLVGANYKQFVLNSEGTLFADTAGRIKIPEWGSFIQLQKEFFNKGLMITASGRYDKTKNYKGQFTPRITALVKVAPKNFIRLSYQTAFRFPITQDQYINLFTGTTWLIGALPEFGARYHFNENPIYTSQSIAKYRQTGSEKELVKGSFVGLKPEMVKTFELGYKSQIGEKLLIDAYIYHSTFTNILGRVSVGQLKDPSTYPTGFLSSFGTTSYTFAQNNNSKVNTRGFGIGLGYLINKSFQLNGNISSDKMYDAPSDFITFFNTPALRYNVGITNPNLWKGFGFAVDYRWQDKINWEGTFGTGEVPAYGTMNAQVSYKFEKTKTMVKIGASNLFNKYYLSAFGNPQIGGLYYVSLGYNLFN